MQNDRQLLLFIAEQAGLGACCMLSTAQVASQLHISQQTASRKMRKLASSGLIEMNASPRGCRVKLTEKGIQVLKGQFVELQRLFGAKKARTLSGKVKVGLGEGAYYVSRKPYLRQFREKLGFTPFFGTLNLIVDLDKLRSFLAGREAILIKGFSTKERDFGPIRAFRVKFGREEAAILFPERSSHPENEIEVIAKANLRKKFRLREGSRAKLTG